MQSGIYSTARIVTHFKNLIQVSDKVVSHIKDITQSRRTEENDSISIDFIVVGPIGEESKKATGMKVKCTLLRYIHLGNHCRVWLWALFRLHVCVHAQGILGRNIISPSC